MALKKYEAKIYINGSGQPTTVTVEANDEAQAMRIIQQKPEFKAFVSTPKIKY